MLDKAKKGLTAAKRTEGKFTAKPAKKLTSWCSWCGVHGEHFLSIKRFVGRYTYVCQSCGLNTLPCRFCDNMAKGALEKNGEVATNGEENKIRQFFKNQWNDELCAEHDGSMSNFARANDKIRELGEFRRLMRPRKLNLYSLAKKTASVAGGAAALGTGAILMAPGIAASMAISTGIPSTAAAMSLSGAGVTMIGSGGLGMVTVTGASLGGRAGFGIANSYLKDVPDYDFHLRRAPLEDSGHRVVCASGFLTENDKDGDDWCDGLEDRFGDSALWYLSWESKNLIKLGEIALRGSRLAATSTALRLAGQSILRGSSAVMALELINNPWHSAMLNAQKSGVLLAEAISRTEGRTFTLIGHSLGARVVFFALQALATKHTVKPLVDKAILMGGAVGRTDAEAWKRAAAAVSGNIYNCYSNQDLVLRFLYQVANLGRSKPAGIGPAKGPPESLKNMDFSDLIDGHNAWKPNLPHVLDRLEVF